MFWALASVGNTLEVVENPANSNKPAIIIASSRKNVTILSTIPERRVPRCRELVDVGEEWAGNFIQPPESSG
jgi:hypothetical protein